MLRECLVIAVEELLLLYTMSTDYNDAVADMLQGTLHSQYICSELVVCRSKSFVLCCCHGE